MSIVHLSYVMCNGCGVPASQPMRDAKEARAMVPANWSQKPFEGDKCPACQITNRTIRAPWDSETGCFGHCDPEGWAECTNRTMGSPDA